MDRFKTIKLESFHFVRFIRFIFYALFFFAPLLMSSQTSEMFEFNKMMSIYLAALVSGVVYIFYYISHPKHLYLPKYIVVPFLLFTLSQCISAYYSIDPHTSFFGYYGRWNGGMLSFFSFGALLFVFLQVFDRKSVIKLLRISLATSFVVLVWGILAKYGYDISCKIFVGTFSNSCWTAQFQPAVRMFSTLGQPNWLGAYLAIHFFIAGYFFYRSYPLLSTHESIMEKSRHILSRFGFSDDSHPFGRHMWYALYLATNFVGIYFTQSRSALLSVITFLVVGCSHILIYAFLKRYRIWAGLLAVCVVVILTIASVYIYSSYSDAQSGDGSQVTDSFEIRKIVWQGALALGKKYPLFGTGPETFAYSYFFEKPEAHNRTSEWDFVYNKAHNEYLNYFATTGLVGTSAYLLFIFSTGYIFIRHIKRKKYNRFFVIMLSYSFGTILFTNFFGFSTSTIQLFFYLIPGMILVIGKDHDMGNRPLLTPPVRYILIGLVLVTGLYGAYILSRYYYADIYYKNAKDAQVYNDYKEASLNFNTSLSLKYEHVVEDALSASLAHLALVTTFEEGETQAEALIELSKGANAHTLRLAPKNIQYWKTRAKNYYLYFQVTQDASDIETAVSTLKHVVSLAPTDADSYYLLGLFYDLSYQATSRQEDKANSIRAYETALKLRPNFIEVQERLNK